jgi:hypothetical protein
VLKTESLVFITPSNPLGYDLTIKYAHKLVFISPVWFHLERDPKTETIEFQGEQDINLNWLSRIRQVNPSVKILPRFNLPSVMGYYKHLLGDKSR